MVEKVEFYNFDEDTQQFKCECGWTGEISELLVEGHEEKGLEIGLDGIFGCLCPKCHKKLVSGNWDSDTYEVSDETILKQLSQ